MNRRLLVANGILQQAAISLKHSMCSHRARSSRSMGSKLLRLLGESLFHPLFEKMLTAQILQGAGRTYIDGSILIFFLFGFDPYSDPYHGKTGRHTLTSNKICFSKKSGIAILAALGGTPRHTVISSIYQFESLLLRQKRTLSPNGDRVLLFLPVHTSKSSINVYQNKIVPQGQKIPCGTGSVKSYAQISL